jgi:hypothetical protein
LDAGNIGGSVLVDENPDLTIVVNHTVLKEARMFKVFCVRLLGAFMKSHKGEAWPWDRGFGRSQLFPLQAFPPFGLSLSVGFLPANLLNRADPLRSATPLCYAAADALV